MGANAEGCAWDGKSQSSKSSKKDKGQSDFGASAAKKQPLPQGAAAQPQAAQQAMV